MGAEIGKGIISVDMSGSWLKEQEGVVAPATPVKDLPPEWFIDKAMNLAYKRAVSLDEYIHEVFSDWRRPAASVSEAIKRSRNQDYWRVLGRDDIQRADLRDVNPDDFAHLRGMKVNETVTEDLRMLKDKYDLYVGSGIDYNAHNGILVQLGQNADLLTAMVLRRSRADTGVEVKMAMNFWMQSNKPRGALVANLEDCVNTGLTLSGSSDLVAMVHPAPRNLDDYVSVIPSHIRVNTGRMTWGQRLTEVLPH